MRFSKGAVATDGSCRKVMAEETRSSLGAMVGRKVTAYISACDLSLFPGEVSRVTRMIYFRKAGKRRGTRVNDGLD